MDERRLAAAKKVPILALRQRRRNLVRMLPDLQEVLRGSLVKRYVTCGKAGCKCTRGDKHGPVWYLSVTLRAGKTVGMQVPGDKVAQIRPLLENHRKLKESLEAISEINWELLRRER